MRALLWDLDDTLLNTLPGRLASLAYAHERCLGHPADPEALWRAHRGGTLELLGQRLLGAGGARFAAAYRDHYYSAERAIEPFPGVTATLEILRGHGIRNAVVTSKIAWGATDELTRAGLLAHFEAVVGVDDVEHPKPDPEPVYEALSRLCIHEPASVMFVGDSPADIWAARNAGCQSIAALWGTLDRELLLDAMPDFRARTPGEIINILVEAQRTHG